MTQMAIIVCMFVEYLPEDDWKKAKTCRSFITCGYIILSYYSAVVGMCVVTCHIYSVTLSLQQMEMYLGFRNSIPTPPLSVCCNYSSLKYFVRDVDIVVVLW